MTKKTMGLMLISFAILIVIFTAGWFWHKYSENGDIFNVSADEKTYANTKYGYSFSYQSGLTLTASNIEGMQNPPVSADADGAIVSRKKQVIFSIGVNSLGTNPEKIKSYFLPGSPQKVTVESVQVAGRSGLKAIVPDNDAKSTFYFVTSNAGQILELSVLDNNDSANDILQSFTLN